MQHQGDDAHKWCSLIKRFVTGHRAAGCTPWLRLPDTFLSRSDQHIYNAPVATTPGRIRATAQILMRRLYKTACHPVPAEEESPVDTATYSDAPPLSNIDIPVCSLLLMLQLWTALDYLQQENNTTFRDVCTHMTAQFQDSCSIAPSEHVQTELAVASMQGLVRYLRVQEKLDDFPTCLSFMTALKTHCPADQTLAEALATEGKHAMLEWAMSSHLRTSSCRQTKGCY